MSNVRYLGTTDEVTTCDHCGRSDLKNTVALQIGEDADPVYYGVTCAAHALKTTVKDVRSASKRADDAKAAAVQAERYRQQKIETDRWFAWLAANAPSGNDPFTRIQALGGYGPARKLYEKETTT